MKWQPNWHRHASSHSGPTLNHNGSGSCNMLPVKHTFRGQSRQVRNQCTRGTMHDLCRLTSVGTRVCWIKDCQRSKTHSLLLSSDTLPKPTGAPLWTVPRWAGTHCLSHRIKLLTTLDYFASQRCGFEALYENTPNPHWIFRTIQYVLISNNSTCSAQQKKQHAACHCWVILSNIVLSYCYYKLITSKFMRIH